MKLYDFLGVYVDINGSTVKAGRLTASFGRGRSLGDSMFTYDQGYFRNKGAYELISLPELAAA